MITDLSEKIHISTLASYCNGKAYGDVYVGSISIDSREISSDTMFAAVKGESTDGHRFIGSAVENGAVCVLCEKIPEDVKCNYIVVEDTIKAIADIGKANKNRISPFTVGVTGSVGKTTTKEFVASVLSSVYPTHKSGGNFNTIYGVSLIMSSMSPLHKALVLEMGMSKFGEIEEMSEAAEPDAVVITNIGTSHIQYLGSRENICKAKLEILKGLKKGGLLVYNGDEPLLYDKRDTFPRSVSFGLENKNVDFYAYNIRETQNDTVFDIKEINGDQVKDVKIPAVGKHNVYNALAAFCVGLEAGIDEKNIRNGLMCYQTTGMRQKIYTHDGYTIIEDCYNASPESMKAALSVLVNIGKDKRTVAVLGDMRELGEHSEELHKKTGRFAAECGIGKLYTYGEEAVEIAVGAFDSGMAEGDVLSYKDLSSPEEFAKVLKNDIRKDDVILFKASRAVALENVINALKGGC